jgi:omega-amidase
MDIALVSLNQIWENKFANLKQCDFYIQKASENKADLVIFPEMTLTGFSMNTALIAEKEDQSNTVKEFQKMANKYCISIIFGVVFTDQDRSTNNLVFIKKNGQLGSKYKKIHPFSYSGEDEVYKGGDKIVVQNFMGINIGLTICYDLRFPEIYTTLGSTCDVVINIANWPKKRIDHWTTLLKSRAIENQYFCIGVNRTGIDGNGLEYEDSSIIFNANGELLLAKNIDNKIKVFNVDKNWTKSFKKTFSTTQDRKLSLYSKFYK